MKRRLHLFMIMFICIMPCMHAALSIDMGNAVKTGTYYTFPNLTVTEGSSIDRAYVIRIMFTRATTAGDAISWPSIIPGGVRNSLSTQYVQMIDISSGATAAELQSFLRTVQFTFTSSKKGQAILVLLSEDNGDAGRRVYYNSDNDHWYEYVTSSGITWTAAYNAALGKQFLGMTGYLATITDAVENSFVYTVTSGAIGWTSGTRMDIRNKQNSSTGILSGNPDTPLNYWYWAAGPEWENNGKDPTKCAFYDKPTHNGAVGITSLKYPYNAWSTNEPNCHSSNEFYTHLLASGLWNDYAVDNGSIQGYLVEYLGSASGAISESLIGFESSKSASGGNGTSASPIQLVYGDEITYTITAANASDVSTSVKIIDKVPDGLEITELGGGSFNAGNREITWNATIPTEGTGSVSFKVKKSLNATGAMTNTAYITSGGITQQTNSTYHTGVMCTVSFTAATGGILHNGNPEQIDYGLSPNVGVTYTENPGYTFAGWGYSAYTNLKGGTQPAASGINDYTSISVFGNMTLTANFNLIPYTITYVMNGATAIPPQTYYVTSAPINLVTPTRTGYSFHGWSGTGLTGTNNTTVTIPTNSTGDRIYTANWDIIPYTITYNNVPGDISNPNQTVYNVESSTFTITPLSKAGYIFKGWTGEGVVQQQTVSIPTGSFGNRTYTAEWDTIDYTIKYMDGLSQVTPSGSPATYRDTDLPKVINATLTKAGWTFIGWSGGAGANNTSAITIPLGVHANQTYHAVWSADPYTITFNANGGTNPTIPSGWLGYDMTDLPINGVNVRPTRPGYTFAGWSGHGLTNEMSPFNITSSTTGVPGNLTYSAGWTIIPYTITYNTNGGNTIASQAYNVTSPLITLPTPTYTGHTFLGWTGEGIIHPQTSVTIPTGSIGNRIYTANWQINAYDITYDYDGGTAPVTSNPVTYTVQTPTFTLNPPTRAGWTFTGWIETGGQTIPPAPTGTSVTINTGSITGDIAYKATWSTVPYTITYNANGGTLPSAPPNPTGYNVTQTPFDITGHPVKPGHTFVGWTGSNGSIPELTVTVTDTAMSNLTYEAKWSFQFADDTVVNCSAPLRLESGNDGLSYVWILPDGSSQTGSSILARTSGRYILYTNYGSIVTNDTIYALIFFEEDLKIGYTSTDGIKIGSTMKFYAPLNEHLQNVTYQWNIQGAVPSTFTGDTATVVFNSPGKRTVSVNITATKGSLTCSKPLSLELMVMSSRNGYFVDQNVSGGTNDGSSWTNAYRKIQDALERAGTNDYIWVAKGTYSPDLNSSFFARYDSIRIYGGFAGWEESLYDRDFAANPTVLKGNGNSVIVNTNANGMLWDGFIIEGGNASYGGGVYNNKASSIIANSTIRSNKADRGGGIYSTQSDPVLYNVVVSGNTAAEGGAIYNELSNLLTTNVTVSGNQATVGGGIYNQSSNPQHRNTIVWGNKADQNANVCNDLSTPGYFYSLIEGSNGSGSWDTSFGTDGGYNLDGSPLFRRNGFDNSGTMVTGDYKLSGNSRVVDKGNRLFVYDIRILTDIVLSSVSDLRYSSLPYDLDGNERIFNDKVDMGAYEYGSSIIHTPINRVVRLPFVDGLILNPEPGEHTVRSHNDFVFTIIPQPGYSLDYLTVKTGIPLYDEEGGIRMVRNEDGSVTVTILQVTSQLDITINGVTPVSNETISGWKVWANTNKLYITTDREADLKIYTSVGYLYLQQKIKEPETVIALDQGIYMVMLDDKVYKIVIKN